jgi:hypothetical protein
MILTKFNLKEIQPFCRWQEFGSFVPKNFSTVSKGIWLFVGNLSHHM